LQELENFEYYAKIYGQLKFMREGQPQMDYPASKLAELEETRVMKHENPTFYLLAQDSQQN